MNFAIEPPPTNLATTVSRYGQREPILSLLEVNFELFPSGNRELSFFLVPFFYLIQEIAVDDINVE